MLLENVEHIQDWPLVAEHLALGELLGNKDLVKGVALAHSLAVIEKLIHVPSIGPAVLDSSYVVGEESGSEDSRGAILAPR